MPKPQLRAVVTAAWADRYGEAIAEAGGEAAYFTDGDTLAAALGAEWAVDLVVVDLGLVTPALARRLAPGGPSLIAFGDPAYAGVALGADRVEFVPDAPTDGELADALRAALTPPPPPGVADLSDRALARLGALGAEASRVAAALARLDAAAAAPPPPIDRDRLKAVIRARRARERFWPAGIFGEPAWDMLLDLACARVERRDVAVSSLCIAAAVPTTTALRWIRNLCDAGLFERRDDPHDARRAFVSLSEAAATAMARYLAETTP